MKETGQDIREAKWIAVAGTAARFADACNARELWHTQRNGVEPTSEGQQVWAQPQDRWLTTRLWKQSPPLASPSAAEPQGWLIVPDGLGLGERLAAHLQGAGHQVVAIEAGSKPARLEQRPEQVLYLAGLQAREAAQAHSALTGLRRLAEDLSEITSAQDGPLWMTVATSSACSITGNEDPFPASAALAAAALALEQQFAGLRLRIVDLDLPDSPSEARSWRQEAQTLVRDLQHGRAGSEWAYRNGSAWVRAPQAVSASLGADSFQARPGGFYALAASGCEAASRVALKLSAHGARILLLHSGLDDLHDNAMVRPARLDLSDVQQLGQALSQAEQDWGKLHGFAHLLSSANSTEAALKEATALSRAFEQHEMDFGLFVLAWPRPQASALRLDEAWLAGWVEGEAARLASAARFPCSTLRIGDASASEVTAALRAIAASRTSSDFRVSLPELRRHLAQCAPRQASAKAVRLFTKIPFEAPRTRIEQRLARIWEEFLGVSPVGIHDSFLELGGHSLLATQVTAKVRRRLRIEVPISLLAEAPTLAALAEAVSSRPQVEAESAAEFPAILHDPSRQQEPFPLTDVQQACWMGRSGSFDLSQAATHHYLEIDSEELDVQRLEQAWQRLIQWHAMLRAVVRPDGRQQILSEVPPCRIEVTELSRDEGEQEAQLDAMRRQMSHQIAPNGRWPLFGLRLARWPDGQRSRLFLSIDRLIADLGSFFILRRDLGLLYDDPQALAPEQEISFRDCVMAAQQLRQGPLYSKALQYWRSRLDSLPTGPDLPVLPAGQSVARFQRRRGWLEADQWERLKRRSARIGVSRPGLLLTVFSLVLAAWSKKPHFTLNLTLNNRLPGHPQADEVVGDFTSLIPLEVDLASRRTFEELARRLQKQLWRDLDHRYASGAWVVRELAVRRPAGVSAALLPVVFTSCLNRGGGNRRGSSIFGLPGREACSISQTPQVWLDHQVAESSQGMLAWNWDAVEGLYPPGMLDAMMEAYQQLLEELAVNEDAWQQEEFGLIPSQDMELQWASNDTDAPEPEGLLHQPLLEQARLRPDHPAVISSQKTLSYRHLSELSIGLAHCLRRFEVSPDTLVAVVMEHGWEQVPAVVGILQSGAAYLPIDANLPHDRLCHLLQEGRIEVALTQSWVDSRLDWPEGLQRISVDAFDPCRWPSEPPQPCQEPDDLAYVIFTSGSTGHPKGVMIEHGAALNTIADINRRFEVGSQDRILAVSALNCDLSVYDIFGLLAAGGSLVMPDRDSLRQPARWLDWVEGQQVTFWNSDPTLVEVLVEQAETGREDALKSLRLCLMSGDWIPPALAGRLRALNPAIQALSGSGATEASIWSILCPIGEVDDPKCKSIPSGRPMTNQRLYVLGAQLQPRPCWAAGQLYIAGLGLARGYWRDKQETEAAFIDHPVSGQRLYRMGKRGRFLPDGNIELLGREDTHP